ncbi:hypothetical protein EU528_14880 [Candidatus Thorarchaeota archaeon]|nr:MAG: hypothetical protein EU528_14880 [Candidatus Thorarchaeota archaeon]
MIENPFDLVINSVNYLLLIIIIICACAAVSKSEESQKKERDTKFESLPPYIRKELSRTATIKEQRDSYSSTGMSGYIRPIPGVAGSLTAVKQPSAKPDQKVKALRGGEFIGNRMRFKVKVLNESQFTITDVKVFLISYPRAALRLDSEDDDVQFPKIEPSGYRSPSFDFLPTQDCVRGEIVAGVSYLDERGQPHLLNTKPFIIRSVCDLLLPDQISPSDFELKLKEMNCGEIVVKVTEWTPEEMHEKVLRILEESNFYEVDSSNSLEDNVYQATISGNAKGKYTGKSVATKVLISGISHERGASCTIQVSGEDQAMILPAIDDLRERLSAWLCPMCGSSLTIKNVEDLRTGKIIICPFCGVSIGR